MDNNKFTAQDARNLAKQQEQANVSQIIDDIKNRIKQGESDLTYDNTKLPKLVVDELENRGFKVTYHFSPKNEQFTTIKWD